MTKRKIKLVITHRTDAEWPPDHPLRVGTTVISPRQAPPDAVLICSPLGEYRQPPPDDDRDVEGICTDCGKPIVHRASAPPHLRKVCINCFGEMAKASE